MCILLHAQMLLQKSAFAGAYIAHKKYTYMRVRTHVRLNLTSEFGLSTLEVRERT